MTDSSSTDASRARERALVFMMAESEGLERSCALVVGGGKEPVDALAQLVEWEQRAVEPADFLRILERLDDIRALTSGLAERVCTQLSARQGVDGSWSASESASEGSEIFCTGMIAGYLAKTRFVRQRTLESAADHLATLFDPDLVRGDAWQSMAAYFHCFALIPHEDADGILQWCGRELHRGLLDGLYNAVCTARVFAWCRAHALPGVPLRREELLERLAGEQREDGGYCQRDGDSKASRVAHTLEALVGLSHLS